MKRLYVLLMVGLFTLVGCERLPGITNHQPGVYMGSADNHQTDNATLQSRFKKIQLDR